MRDDRAKEDDDATYVLSQRKLCRAVRVCFNHFNTRTHFGLAGEQQQQARVTSPPRSISHRQISGKYGPRNEERAGIQGKTCPIPARKRRPEANEPRVDLLICALIVSSSQRRRIAHRAVGELKSRGPRTIALAATVKPASNSAERPCDMATGPCPSAIVRAITGCQGAPVDGVVNSFFFRAKIRSAQCCVRGVRVSSFRADTQAGTNGPLLVRKRTARCASPVLGSGGAGGGRSRQLFHQRRGRCGRRRDKRYGIPVRASWRAAAKQ